MDSSKIRNPNLALLEQRRALTKLLALDAASSSSASTDAPDAPKIEAQSAHEGSEFRKAVFRSLRT